MPLPSEKIMFEIYRESEYDRRFRVVYFTELDEHNKEGEINKAMSGEHVYDGFLAAATVIAGKKQIEDILRRLNAGEALAPADFDTQLAAVLA